jgi:hypothetical protein
MEWSEDVIKWSFISTEGGEETESGLAKLEW